MEARYQLRQSPLSVTRQPVTSATDPTFEAPDEPAEQGRRSVEEDRQPARVVGMEEYGPEHAVEDQVHAHHVGQRSGAVEDVALNQRKRRCQEGSQL